jgi:Fe-S-cluster-containing dehydrogenase component
MPDPNRKMGWEVIPMVKRWHMIIDVAQCEDCNNCFMACKDEYEMNDWPGYSAPQPRHGQQWMNIERKERGQYPLNDVSYRPTPCMHCDNPPCMAKANEKVPDAVVKRDDGIVIIDPVKAKGLNLVDACPYGAIQWNEEAQLSQKCTFCAHMLDNEGFTKPRCVTVCPTGALRTVFVEDDEFNKMIENEALKPLHPEYGTQPTIYYKNLYRYNSVFIAGSICFKNGSVIDVAKGAIVTLKGIATKTILSSEADMFGDFKFDGLDENSGQYEVVVEYQGKVKSIRVALTQSVNIGTIEL